MPYKRKDSPYYYVRRRRLPGYGDTGRISSGVTLKKIAHTMERTLEEIAQQALSDPSLYDLLDAVCRREDGGRTITLAELLRAKNMGTLETLKRRLNDPTILQAIEAFRLAVPLKKADRVGLDHLAHAVGRSARLSSLDGRTITRLCHAWQAGGNKRNSVRRYQLRAISKLLRYHLSSSERDKIFKDVVFPAVDDTREVHLLPAEIARLLAACHEIGHAELATIIRVALSTSADRGVLLSGAHEGQIRRGLLVRDLRIYQDGATGAYSGEVFLKDTKTDHRSRSVPIADGLCRDLLPLVRMKAPGDPVFGLSYSQLDHVWKRARSAADLKHVRFKDLRAQISIYGEEAGVPQTVLSKVMGHSDERMTRRYQQRQAVLSGDQASALEQAMFAGGERDVRRAG